MIKNLKKAVVCNLLKKKTLSYFLEQNFKDGNIS